MKLGDRQRAFARMVPRLIDKAHEMGYEVTGGDWHRDKRCNYGSKTSKHHTKEAIDLNLFLNGKYLRKTEDHRKLGEWWESQGAIWGGNFSNRDGNHYQGSKSGLYTPDPVIDAICPPVMDEQTVTITISSTAPLTVEANDK